MNILQLKDIIHEYNGKRVLDIPSLAFQKGEVYSIVGPNGSGKTTLLSILSLIQRPTKGKVFFKGNETNYDINAIRSLTMVHQNPYLFNLSVGGNITYGLRARNIPKPERVSRVKRVLEMVDLSGFENRHSKEISGGEIQLVALARALVIEPEVLFLDEPTANLDFRHIRVIEETIQKVNKDKGTTIISTTHNLSQAYRTTNKVLTLLNGSLIPSTIHNLLSGSLKHIDGETFFDTGRIKIWVSSDIKSRHDAHLTIDPEDIIVSRQPFASSARNLFKGIITKITNQGGSVSLEVKSSETFIAIITERSLKELDLNAGTEVYLTFKASSVHPL